MRTGLALLVLVASAHAAAQSPSIYQRRIDASATISGSPGLRDGSYQMSGTAAICGEIPKDASLSGEASFNIEVAGGTTGTMTSIAFGSKQLVGVTPATRFRLSVGVVTARGGRPPQYVLNTDPPTSGNTGTATLSTVNGATTLRVVGRDVANETIELSVTCR